MTSMNIDSMLDLFEHELRGAFYMGRQLVDVLEDSSRRATNDRIADGFADHRVETLIQSFD